MKLNKMIAFIVSIVFIPVLVFGDTNNDTLVLQIGSNKATINGESFELDSEPIIHKDRTMVPIRFIADAFGAGINWDGKTKTITIEQKNPELLDAQTTINEISEVINDARIGLKIQATGKIDIKIVEAIKTLASKGNKVRLILNSNPENRASFSDNVNSNLQINWACEWEIPKSEYVVVDDEICFTGNSSLFDKSDSQGNSNTIKFSNKSLAKQYTIEFDTLWANVEGDCIPGYPEPTNQVWKTEWFKQSTYSMSLTENDIIVTWGSSGIYFFDTNTGKLLGEIDETNTHYRGFTHGDFIIYGHKNDDDTITVKKFNPRTEQTTWSYDIDNPIEHTQQIASYLDGVIHLWGDEYLLVGKKNGSDIINLETGEWVRTLEIENSFPYAVVNDMLISIGYPIQKASILAYDINGNKLWNSEDGYISNQIRNEGLKIVNLCVNQKYLFRSFEGEFDNLYSLFDINSGKAIWETIPNTAGNKVFLSDNYLFVSRVMDNRSDYRGYMSIGLKSLQEVTTVNPDHIHATWAVNLFGYKNGQVLAGSINMLHSYRVTGGAIDFENPVWKKQVGGDTIPNKHNTLYDENNHSYYIFDNGYMARDKPGLIKYTCDK
jgi:hypothetical protein